MNRPGFHQTSTRRRQSQAFVGMLAIASSLVLTTTLVNSAPQAKQVSTLTVDTARDAHDYVYTLLGKVKTLTSGTGETQASIATKIATQINEDADLRGTVEASAALAVVTITALNPGRSFTISESDDDLSLATTTASAVADAVKAGRAVTGEGLDPSTNPDTDTELGHVTASAYATAQAWTFTGASLASGDSVSAEVVYEGVKYQVVQAFDTNNDTTMASLASKLNAALPANSVLAAAASGVLTLTSEVPGQTFDASATAYGGGGGTVSRTSTSTAVGADFWYGFGVAYRDYDEEVDADGEMAYPGNAGMKVLLQGPIWVANSETPAAGADVYVYVGATSADRGKFYASAGTDRVKVPRHLAVWRGRSDRYDGSVSMLEVRPRFAA